MKRLITALMFTLGLAALSSSAALALSGPVAYAVQEKETATDILSAPVDGDRVDGVWWNSCVLSTGKTAQGSDGQTWIEVSRPYQGWIPEKASLAENSTCQLAFQLQDSIYETTAGAPQCKKNAHVALSDVPEFREWLKSIASPSVMFFHEIPTGKTNARTESQKKAVREILEDLNYVQIYDDDCKRLTADEFSRYLVPVLDGGENRVHFTINDDLMDYTRKLHFVLTDPIGDSKLYKVSLKSYI